MAHSLNKLMTILDNNSGAIKESDYIEACDLLKDIHSIISNKQPTYDELVQYAAQQPLPEENSEPEAIRRLLHSKWQNMTDSRKLEALRFELDIFDISDSSGEQLENLEKRVLVQYGKDEKSSLEKHTFLKKLYEDFRLMINKGIDHKIEMTREGLM